MNRDKLSCILQIVSPAAPHPIPPLRFVPIRTKCVKFCILFLLNSIPHKMLVFYILLW